MPAAPEDAEVKEILKILERDSRVTPEQIAEMTGRDAGEVARLIAEAEAEGIIRRYKSVIDWERAGNERVLAFIDVRVLPEPNHGFDDIARRIYRHPEVRSVYLVSGQNDLRVIVEGRTMREVAFFVAERLATIEQVQATTTNFILKRYKEDGDIFEDQEPDRRLAVAP
ncbi:MAG TPA: Lrp/AsnC family transcriptional regulator [Armatimonadota bacterium]|nr:Lrp/AsnC family transcriptional regulator [Armatimonadota bacterium]HOQ29650.1 Lrp/AsnC family transcriptional regulator [Armatimonadota bacterium]HPO74474.1 Lrp/AsnC family transcriptional regulator [Armatimonadota bacterium]HPT98688.1 Lrp/AsnC family transcriptional regulator [Armatimonadota bacterium]